ncbi:MAG: hypothetical protein AB1918_16550 [Pseudomonadota bacterium]
MKRLSVMLSCLLPLALSACGIPDIVAHGVKEFDKSQRKGGEVQPAAAPAHVQRPAPAVVQEEPPPPVYSGPAPSVRESISVEALPPPK